jgi:NAD(P)-dependent dehydrogenase (short-subunit alcohol dehydrogenase family)
VESLNGKVVLVSGASRGIGLAIAKALGEQGARLILTARHRPHLEHVAARMPAAVMAMAADVTSPSDVKRLFATVRKRIGRLDVLINNAGGRLTPPGRTQRLRLSEAWAASVPEDELRYTVDLNLIGTILCCQAAAVPMKQQKSGNVINVGSVGGLENCAHSGRGADYAVAKAGIIHYTRLLAAELGPHGIRVNCIAPGYITSSRSVAQAQATDELAKGFPLGRLGTPEDCANVIEFLVSNLSSYVTGHCITIDGGFSLTHMWPT